MRKLLLLLLATCLLATTLVGCGSKEGVLVPDKKAYLWFTGSTEGVSLYIDAQGPFELAPNYTTDEKNNKTPRNAPLHYEIDPGKHTITLMRGGNVILERTLLIGNHMTQEIEIP